MTAATDIYYQVGELLKKGNRMPPALLALLQNPNIVKTGRNIRADIARLFRDFNLPETTPHAGVIELGKLCKERNIVKDACKGLADLVAITLRRRLPKPDHIRISSDWDRTSLSDEQVKYATLDAYASLRVYEEAEAIPAPGPVPTSAPEGARVAVRSADRTAIVAIGTLAELPRSLDRQKGKYDGINVASTKTRVLVNVESIAIPAAIISTHNKRSLASFGAAPFLLVCDRRHLQTAPPQSHSSDALHSDSVPIVPHAQIPSSPAAPMPISPSTEHLSSDDGPEDNDEAGEERRNELRVIALGGGPATEEQTLEGAEQDPEAMQFATQLADQGGSEVGQHIFSRIIGDAWHIMDRIKTPKNHGLRVKFIRAFRDILFSVVKEDKDRVEAVLVSKNLTWDVQLARGPTYLWKRVRRIIPPPDELLPLLSQLFQIFGPLKDAKTGEPLFKDKTAWDDARNVLENVRLGYVSDPPGIPLYFKMGQDKDGLPLWRCARGTNATEGGVHQNLHHRISPYNASPRYGSNLVADFTLTRNLNVSFRSLFIAHWPNHEFIPWCDTHCRLARLHVPGRFGSATTAYPFLTNSALS